jgi:hypothetical protein
VHRRIDRRATLALRRIEAAAPQPDLEKVRLTGDQRQRATRSIGQVVVLPRRMIDDVPA